MSSEEKVSPEIAHFHHGAIKMSSAEWEKIYKLLLTKRPDLVPAFKTHSFLLDDMMVVAKKEGCVFLDNDQHHCVLQKLLNLTPNCSCIFAKPPEEKKE